MTTEPVGALLRSGITGDPLSGSDATARCVGGGEAVTAGADERFAAFVTDTRTGLTRALTAYHGPQRASDLVAEAFAYAWTNWERIEPMRNPGGYLFRLADRLGQRQSISANREPVTDPDQFVSNPWFDSEHHHELVSLLSGLPPRQRAAVLLIHAYGYTYRETAALLDLPVTTITNDAIRGVKALRALGRSK
jgi:RNA polymerase sigma factor (sigma-70 family)